MIKYCILDRQLKAGDYSLASHLRLGLTVYGVHVGSSSKALNSEETTTLAWD
jgi:hypothetical protein